MVKARELASKDEELVALKELLNTYKAKSDSKVKKN